MTTHPSVAPDGMPKGYSAEPSVYVCPNGPFCREPGCGLIQRGARNVLACFKSEADARTCLRFAASKYELTPIELHGNAGGRYPWSICIAERGRSAAERREVALARVNGDCREAIAFIKGFAYALGDESRIDEVGCRGDERERYA